MTSIFMVQPGSQDIPEKQKKSTQKSQNQWLSRMLLLWRYFISTISEMLQPKILQSTSMVCRDTYMFFRIRPSCPALNLYWLISRYWLMLFRRSVSQKGAYDISIVISPLCPQKNGNASNRVNVFYHERLNISSWLFLTFLWIYS